MKTTKKTTQNLQIEYNPQLDLAKESKRAISKTLKAKDILSKTVLPKEIAQPFAKKTL